MPDPIPTIAISTSSFGRHDSRPLDRLRNAGFEVRLNPHGRRLERPETATLLDGIVGLIAGTETLDREILTAASELRAIARCGSGLDNLDRKAAAALGIALRSTPEPPAEAVAEMTLGGILNLLRHLSAADRDLRQGTWRKPMGNLLRGRTIGLVGLGRVGKRLVELLTPFACPILASDPVPDDWFADHHGIRYLELDRLLAQADVVSLHLTPPAGSGCLLDGERLARLKPGAILINTARGGLVDEAALYDLLTTDKLAGAYLDVFADEPYDGPLRELPQVLLSPHIGSYAIESRVRMEDEAAELLLEALAVEGQMLEEMRR
jgi:D-3-phosphoglycerate dehydrogenase